jgi:hypothetical protein
LRTDGEEPEVGAVVAWRHLLDPPTGATAPGDLSVQGLSTMIVVPSLSVSGSVLPY